MKNPLFRISSLGMLCGWCFWGMPAAAGPPDDIEESAASDPAVEDAADAEGDLLLGGGDTRIPITQADIPMVISTPGSYVVTEDLTGVANAHGILILSDEVSIDFDGHSFIGSPSTLHCIYMPFAVRHIVISDGVIRRWGRNGIWGNDPPGCRIERMMVQDCAQTGIKVGKLCIVRDCISRNNAVNGIEVNTGAVVENCNVGFSGQNGIVAGEGCIIEGCNVVFTLGQYQILAGNGSNVSNCQVRTGVTGIFAGTGSLIRDTTLRLHSGDGILSNGPLTIQNCDITESGGRAIVVNGGCKVLANRCSANGLATGEPALHVSGAGNVIEANHLADNARGLKVVTGGNLVIRNRAHANNGFDYDISPGNAVGPIIGAADIGTNSNPDANHVF